MHNEREWVEEIRRDYQEKSVKESKIERLHKLDRAARRPANIFAYTFGVIGALVLGVGMCLAMGVIGDLFALGIVVGVLGIAMVSVNYFIYRAKPEGKSMPGRSSRFPTNCSAMSEF